MAVLIETFLAGTNVTTHHVFKADSSLLHLVSDKVYDAFVIAVYVCVILIFSLMGATANVVNMVVFIRMGLLSDSSNVSLFGLAIADLGGVTSLTMLSILTLIDQLHIPDLSWDPESVLYIAAGWPHVMFAQITCWITAFIAFERCVCVVFPFKVKTLFTTKFSIFVTSGIIFYFVASYTPIFGTQNLRWKRDPRTNTTRLIAHFEPFYQNVETVIHYLNSVVSPTLSMVIVLICTKVTTSRLQSLSSWRANMGTSDASESKNKPENPTPDESSKTQTKPRENPEAINNSIQKERKLIKMITSICFVFMACNLPGIVIIYVRKVFPEIRHHGAYHNLFHLLYGSSFVLETINSSVNIFIYYSLSTRFRQVFRMCFRLH